MRRRSVSLAIVAGVVLTVAAPWAARADSNAGIRKVDTSAFPSVAVTISLPGTPSLSADDVRLVENGQPVSVDGVQPLGATSIDVVLAIDASDSMRGDAISSAVAAAKRFVQGLPAESRVGLVTFSSSARVVVPLTPDRSKISAGLSHPPALGPGTALFDAVVRSAELFPRDDGQHNILLLSDGANNAGTSDVTAAISAADAAGATLFTIGFRAGGTDAQTMTKLADATNGAYQSAQTAKLSSLYARLATQISDQFVVTYRSSASPGGQLDLRMQAAGNVVSALVLAPKPHVGGPVQPETHDVHPLLRGTLGMLIAILVTFVALFLLGVLLIGTGARVRRDRAAEQRMRAVARPHETESAEQRAANWIPAPMVEVAERVADAGGFGASLEARLERSGLAFRAGEFLAATVFAGLGGMAAGFVLLQNLYLAIGCGVVGGSAPWLVLSYKDRQRTEKLNQQLPEVLNVLASSLRAGHSFLQALDTAAKDVPEPAAGEFSRTLAEIRLGRSLDEAMNAMGERVGSENFRWAVLAVNIQREVGGNLAEILDTVANTVRERETLHREVRVLTTEGRLSMYVLIALPILFAFYLFSTRREYVSLLYTTRVGLVMLVTACALLGVGFAWFKKIVRIDV